MNCFLQIFAEFLVQARYLFNKKKAENRLHAAKPFQPQNHSINLGGQPVADVYDFHR